MDQTASDAGYQETVVDLKLDGVLEGLALVCEHAVELLGLGHGSWEAVEDETGGLSVDALARSNFSTLSTYPFLHSLLFSSWSRIMFTMMSSDTSFPSSIIFFACLPSSVFAATCARSMSPVAR